MANPQTAPANTAQDIELATLDLEEIGPLGDTMARLDSETVNVFGGIPGERVVARIVRYRRRRKRLVSGMVAEVIEPSAHRISPPCPYFGPCSGCQWQHIDYGHQLRLKREAVSAALAKYDELRDLPVSDTIPSPEVFGYRNHARFTARREGSLGFVNRITRRFVDVDSCMIMDPGINDTLGELQGKSQETSQLSIRYGTRTSDVLVQPKLDNPDISIETGQTHYRERVLGREFRIASPSFFQVNTAQAEKLALLVRDRLGLTGAETLVDAYAGVGTFAVLLARYAKRVIAIEESEAAVKDAESNSLGIPNVEFREGKTEDELAKLSERPDALIVDPPRAGCQPPALESIARLAPDRTVYVSCEPETLARDLHALVQGGLTVESVEPVDMFPQTYHVECVATLTSGNRS